MYSPTSLTVKIQSVVALVAVAGYLVDPEDVNTYNWYSPEIPSTKVPLCSSPIFRSIAFDVFHFCAWQIRNFGLLRSSPYKRVPNGPNEKTEANFWNLWSYGALIRRIRGIPLPSQAFHNGTTIEAMGLAQENAKTQATVEDKIRESAAELMDAPFGFRPAIGYQYARLQVPVDGPEYGLPMNKFNKATTVIPGGNERFEKQYERQAPGFSKLQVNEKPEDILHFDIQEAYGAKINGIHPILIESSPVVKSAA